MIEYKVRVYRDGETYWYLNGVLHCEHGPAIQYSDGYDEWYLNGKLFTEANHKTATSKSTCDGKIVEIDGKKYQLKEVQND